MEVLYPPAILVPSGRSFQAESHQCLLAIRASRTTASVEEEVDRLPYDLPRSAEICRDPAEICRDPAAIWSSYGTLSARKERRCPHEGASIDAQMTRSVSSGYAKSDTTNSPDVLSHRSVTRERCSGPLVAPHVAPDSRRFHEHCFVLVGSQP